MRQLLGSLLASLVAVSAAVPALAQGPSTVVVDLLADIEDVQRKLVALSGAIPAGKHGWRPGADTRSVREVLLHVASDNYFIPTAGGITAPAATGITAGDMKGVEAFEKQDLDPAATVRALETSFEHLKQAMRATDDAAMQRRISLFGRPSTMQNLWIITTTHLHEHLGQLIAYARSNGIVPPWSR